MELNPTRSRHIGSELITFGIKSDQSTFLRTTRGGRVLIPTRNVPSYESLKTNCSNESLKTYRSNESLKTYCSNESLKTCCSNESLKTYCSNDVHLGSVTTRGLAQIWLRLATGLAMEHGVRKTVCSCTRVVRQRHEVKLALLKASLRTEQYRRSKSLASLSS